MEDGTLVYFALPAAPYGSLAEQTIVGKKLNVRLPDGIDDFTAGDLSTFCKVETIGESPRRFYNRTEQARKRRSRWGEHRHVREEREHKPERISKVTATR
ncbi:hypothetical protein [Paenibacillus sp. FSL H8-0034]|uniref:hypothetical protein n=1 Tax=Paenibacillus sp. FSL H8-0034 TaxID=2954671 RepID=UPI0030F914AD